MFTKNLNPNFILVKIPKEEQAEKMRKGCILHLHPSFIFGTRALQSGEIVAIGKVAKLVLPKAKECDTLFFSWKVEYVGEHINPSIVYEDENYFYHTVTIAEYKGRDMECYGYFNGETIITHPSFVILEPKEKEVTNNLKETPSGLFVFDKYQMSDSEIMQKIEFNKNYIVSLSNTYAMQSMQSEFNARQTKSMIDALEKENKELSIQLHKTEYYENRIVAYCNPLQEAEPGMHIYAWNIMCLETIDINQKEYNVVNYRHIGMREVKEKTKHSFSLQEAI